MMECLYEIIGNNVLGNKVRLTVKPFEKKQKLDPMGALGNIGGFLSDMKNEASMMNNPDVISIPLDEWKKHRLNIGDVITIKIMVGE